MKRTTKSFFFNDLKQMFRKPEFWLYMAMVDISLRYKRTKLGPFWLVIVSFITIVCIAGLGTLLFRVRWGDFFPYVACGMVIWTYIAAMITDSCVVFIAQLGIIKHVNVSLLSFGLRMFVRNTIIFLHSLPVLILILLYYKVSFWFTILLLIPGLLIFSITAISISVIIGFVSTRFRDILQLIQAVIGICAFLTPIMWKPEMLGDKAYLTSFNPLTHYISILREPLLGQYPQTISYVFTFTSSIIFLGLANVIYNKYRKQLVHWL